ncbi:hypothetical protein JT965_001782 [Salmonella enterica]|nr:hypothetical protein [Salmonella enterica subsp. enterica serovar Enteritidis]EGF8152974.1 hypothetical protein [Salmonella enterica subsp. enterica serovar Enteritidis]EHA2521352.1 hypothetical protein [Salmonella enterica]EHC0363302.1 hypothetical protein [Salmonella enterica]
MNFALIVFPAPAGINRQLHGVQPGYTRVPRASGDKPSEQERNVYQLMCSPRQRG